MPFIPELLKYRNKYFVETGTYKGETTQLVADSGFFDTIYTLEYDDTFYTDAVKKFESTPNVHCFHGTSRTDLFFVIKDIDQPITFWLDAHWGGGAPTVDNDIKCPILHELEQIRNHPIKTHTIIIDDMRLMDGQHFSVTIPQIIQKLLEINPNYILKGYADSETINDVLVACIDEPAPYCVHKYAKVLPFPTMPPGIGDFLRGTISMILHSQTYTYRFFIDHTCHPIFEWLEPSEYSIHYKIEEHTKYFLNYLDYGDKQIARDLELAFKTGSSFVCSNNAFYLYEGDKPITTLTNTHAKEVMKKILVPNAKLKSYILDTYKKLGLQSNVPYIVIHLRCGDQSLFNKDMYSQPLVDYFTAKIQDILRENPTVAFVLITDSSAVGRILKERIPSLFYTDLPRIHLGGLNAESSAIPFTLTEMFIIINSKMILSNSRSGFSDIPSQIFDIPYHPVF